MSNTNMLFPETPPKINISSTNNNLFYVLDIQGNTVNIIEGTKEDLLKNGYNISSITDNEAAINQAARGIIGNSQKRNMTAEDYVNKMKHL